MDSDRKYRQNGYQDSGHGPANGHREGLRNGDKPKPSGPKPSIDITGPRLPRLVQAVTASRCFNCATTLPPGTEFSGNCPKCNSALHCCKQCAYFEPSTRFQCMKPVPARIAVKDQANECSVFKPRLTVARDATSQPSPGANRQPPTLNTPPPKNALDAKEAFDRLFSKL